MKKLLLVLGALFVAAVLSADVPAPIGAGAAAETAGVSGRIVGGQEVNPSFRYPFLAAVLRSNAPSSGPVVNSQFCGASRVGPRHFLSAAHCQLTAGMLIESPRHNLNVAVTQEAASGGARRFTITKFGEGCFFYFFFFFFFFIFLSRRFFNFGKCFILF
jgi:secreted trypsin-like serine protease